LLCSLLPVLELGARMRLLVHFTTTTYACYECWTPQASSFATPFNIFIYILPTYFSFILYLLCLLLCSLLNFDNLQTQELIDVRTKNYKVESKRKTGYGGRRENKKKSIKYVRHGQLVCYIQRYIQ
jgi:hypothetical protein